MAPNTEGLEITQQAQMEHIEKLESHRYIEPTKTALNRGTDDALNFTATHEDITWTPDEERRLLRKLDMRIIPLVI